LPADTNLQIFKFSNLPIFQSAPANGIFASFMYKTGGFMYAGGKFIKKTAFLVAYEKIVPIFAPEI
jgi:hypothetical protein